MGAVVGIAGLAWSSATASAARTRLRLSVSFHTGSALRSKLGCSPRTFSHNVCGGSSSACGTRWPLRKYWSAPPYTLTPAPASAQVHQPLSGQGSPAVACVPSGDPATGAGADAAAGPVGRTRMLEAILSHGSSIACWLNVDWTGAPPDFGLFPVDISRWVAGFSTLSCVPGSSQSRPVDDAEVQFRHLHHRFFAGQTVDGARTPAQRGKAQPFPQRLLGVHLGAALKQGRPRAVKPGHRVERDPDVGVPGESREQHRLLHLVGADGVKQHARTEADAGGGRDGVGWHRLQLIDPLVHRRIY